MDDMGKAMDVLLIRWTGVDHGPIRAACGGPAAFVPPLVPAFLLGLHSPQTGVDQPGVRHDELFVHSQRRGGVPSGRSGVAGDRALRHHPMAGGTGALRAARDLGGVVPDLRCRLSARAAPAGFCPPRPTGLVPARRRGRTGGAGGDGPAAPGGPAAGSGRPD